MNGGLDAVVFDLDGVLCDYDIAARLDHMARLTRRAAPDIRAAIFESGWDALSDTGAIGAEDYLVGCAVRLGAPVSRVDWLAARAAAMTPKPEVLEIARALAARVPAAVFTNNNAILERSLPVLFPQVAEIFGARVYFSASLGLAKPDPAAFGAVLARLGNPVPERTLFIDDQADYIAGAARAGLRTHRFTGAAALRAAVAELGLI